MRILALLNAVERLVVLRVSFAPDGVRHGGSRHQVAFIGGVDEHFTSVDLSGLDLDRDDSLTLFDHAPLAIKPLISDHHDVMFLDESFVGTFSHARFKRPHRIVVGTVTIVLFGSLVHPGGRLIVMLFDPLIEFSRETTNHRFVSAIGPAQATTGQSTQMPPGLDHDNRLAHPSDLHCSRDPGRGTSINNHIKFTHVRVSDVHRTTK